jgi:pSer/pThr/pTyr-binding forkhead associated (FHA) protein
MLLQPTSPVGPMAPRSPAVAVQPAREVTAPVAWLVVEQGPQTGQRWPVPLGETSLGRRRADNDIVVPSGTASRRHAVIRADTENCVYYDLEPTNPTLINDAAIVGPHELTEGDHIRIGDVILRFTMQ